MVEAILLLQLVMGGAIYTLATVPGQAVAAVFPAAVSYGLYWLAEQKKVADPKLTAAAMAAGVVGGIVLRTMAPKGKPKAAPAKGKAGGKKAK